MPCLVNHFAQGSLLLAKVRYHMARLLRRTIHVEVQQYTVEMVAQIGCHGHQVIHKGFGHGSDQILQARPMLQVYHEENTRNEKDKYTAMQTEATNLLASGVELSKMTNK